MFIYLFLLQLGRPIVWRDGGEGKNGRGSGRDGSLLPAIQSENLHHPASEDELLQAVAGSAVPTGSYQI